MTHPVHLGMKFNDVLTRGCRVIGYCDGVVAYVPGPENRHHYNNGRSMISTTMEEHATTEDHAELKGFEPISREVWERAIPVGFERYRHALNQALREEMGE